ncbi:MAG TPA: oxidoreductase, partial [Lactobacillus sp.]|nr:oxidoreductase [Lactobacillus sp.]
GPDDAEKFSGRFSASQFKTILAALREVDGIADAHQATIAQIMLAWYMKNPDIAVVIPGARLPEQAASNAEALKVQLRDPEYGSINELFKEFRPK